MTEVRIAAMGRTRDAEVLDELEDGRVRVRYADNGRVAVVPAGKVVGRGDGARARVKPPSAKAPFPPLMRASDLLLPPPSRPFEPGRTKPVPKPAGPARSPRYLAFVRMHRCAICSAPPPSHAHHHGPRGMSQKTDDYRTIPLCHGDHDAYHTGNLPQLTDDVVARAQRELLVEYTRQIEGT